MCKKQEIVVCAHIHNLMIFYVYCKSLSTLSPRLQHKKRSYSFICVHLKCPSRLSPLPFHIKVINCAGITKNGQDDDVYRDNILQISVLAAKEAACRKVKKFIELSTAHVYAADKVCACVCVCVCVCVCACVCVEKRQGAWLIMGYIP